MSFLPSETCRDRTDCRLCSGPLRHLFSLPATPLANDLHDEPESVSATTLYPLDLKMCLICGHVQLGAVVQPAKLFEGYRYLSGASPMLKDHFENYAAYLFEHGWARSGDIAVDIGANDGVLSAALKAHGAYTIGIEPALGPLLEAEKRRAFDCPVRGFFDLDMARRILQSHGCANLITANNVFAHVDDLAGFTQAVRLLLAPAGVFAIEFQYLRDLIEGGLWDMIYHEHVSYHSLRPLDGFFERMGMRIVAAQRIRTHGGSLRVFVRHLAAGELDRASTQYVDVLSAQETMVGLFRPETYEVLASNAGRADEVMRDLTSRIPGEVWGLGAPAKAVTLLYAMPSLRQKLKFVVDDNPMKRGLYLPGTNIAILGPDSLMGGAGRTSSLPDFLVLLAWNYAEDLMRRFPDWRGRFIVPLPEPKIV